LSRWSSLACLAGLAIAAVAPALGQSAQSGQPDQSDQQEEPYAGPSILTRDSSTAGEHGGKLLDFQFWGAISGVADSGLTPVATNSSGKVTSDSLAYGLSASGGVSGSKTWEADQLRLDYSGSWTQYYPSTGLGGVGQFLDLAWSHRVSRHVQMSVQEVGGVSLLSVGQLTYVPLSNTQLIGVPINQLFDNATYFSQSAVSLTWQESARVSFSFGGSYFLMRPQSSDLVSTNGLTGHGDIGYRISKRQTLSMSYAWEYFDYAHTYGNSKVNQAEGGWSIGLGKRSQFGLDGGAAYVQTQGLIQVPLPPAVAAIVGQGYTTTTSLRDITVPVGQAQFSQRFATSSLNVNCGISVMPGNGVFLTSRAMNAGVGYSLVTVKKMNFGATGGFSRMTSIGQQTIAPYDGYYGGAGMTYRLFARVGMDARYDWYRYNVAAVSNKNENRFSAGLSYSSGEHPLSIW
jgi:hypothetical protein